MPALITSITYQLTGNNKNNTFTRLPDAGKIVFITSLAYLTLEKWNLSLSLRHLQARALFQDHVQSSI